MNSIDTFNGVILKLEYDLMAKSDTRSMWIFLAIILLFLIILIVGRRMGGRGNTRLSPEQRRKYNKFVFRRMARDIGLQKSHTEMLDYLVRACKVKQPFLVFSNAGLLDDIIRKGIYSLDHNRDINEEAREQNLSLIFQIKQIIERNSRKGIGIRSTNLLKSGQPLVVTEESSGQYAMKVVSNMRDMLCLNTPHNKAGHDFRWRKGTRLRAHFWRDSDAGYSFQTKVLGYDTIKGKISVLIQHSKTLRREQKRKFRRRPLEKPSFFYPIQIIETGVGRKKKRRAIVEQSKRHLGTVADISAGGCSINSLNPLSQGELIKIEFEIERGTRIAVFGKIKRFGKNKVRGGVMHVMFTKVSGRYLNRIYSYVYNYTSSSRFNA
jgi:hypothetical protein